MTKIAPFKALRPVRDKVHLVAARPLGSYKSSVLKAKLEDNPYTFLRIIHPDHGKESLQGISSVERFQLVKEKYDEFIANGVLIKDEQAHIYVYRQTKDDHSFTGIIAGASIDEYNSDLIKKHEATLTSREQMFTQYLDIVGYNAEPVLLSHPHNAKIEELLRHFTDSRPEYEFSTTDCIKHELWILNEEQSHQITNAFLNLPCVYIADGHHRSASSARLKNERKAAGKASLANEDYFLAYFIDENLLKILEFNRLVKNLNGLSEDSFLSKLSESFTITTIDHAQKPVQEHQISMCLKGNWYLLECKSNIVHEDHPVNCLDAEILTREILQPILGINDLKTSDSVEFVSGAETIIDFESKITSGQFDVGFILYPVSVDQVKRVADNHLIMPPKSTWVEPKMRSGLTVYKINE